MILHPDAMLALMSEMRRRDLALVAIVAGMQDDEDAACERLAEIEQAMREWRKTANGRSKQVAQRRELADDVIQIAPRLAHAIRQVQSSRVASV